MEWQDLMNIVDEADCNAEVCFTNSKEQRAVMGWAKTLIEISFKAGQEHGLVIAKKNYLLGKAHGRKEVAKWIKGHWSCRYPVGSSGYDEWKAKLKEWGI